MPVDVLIFVYPLLSLHRSARTTPQILIISRFLSMMMVFKSCVAFYFGASHPGSIYRQNHPQATVRLLSKPVPVPGTSKHSRFTLLTCLFCALSVYRVHHVISLDVEGNSTTFLPSEEWVEKEVLKSGLGWIDVHKDCLVCGLLCISTFNNMKERDCSSFGLFR